MGTWARSNKAGEILEIRNFVEGEQDPVDIPHKDVIWREVEVQREEHDPETQDLSCLYRIEGDKVVESYTPVGKCIQKLRKEVYAAMRQKYHLGILDAMPDMKKVAGICAERDEVYALVRVEDDYKLLRGMLNAED